MDFASSKVYIGEEAEETVGQAELQAGWATSNLVDLSASDNDSDDMPDLDPAPQAPASPPQSMLGRLFGSLRSARAPEPEVARAPTSKRARFNVKSRLKMKSGGPAFESAGAAHRQAVDTNVVAVKLGTLANDVDVHTGDVELCKQCMAALNSFSVVAEGVWACEFCGTPNEVDMCPEEMPASESVDYIIKAAPAVQASEDEGRVIFCVDISGSMCVTTEVPGHVALRGDRREALQAELGSHTEGSQQFLPRERRDVTYVSRLQSMQAAVEQQLQSLKAQYPNKSVGLVTFNSEVKVLGDGTQDPITIAGDRLRDSDAIMEYVRNSNVLTQKISESCDSLSEQLFALEEGGQTALGPALSASVALAAGRAGSQVFVCTDGLANVGVGSLDLGDEVNAVAEEKAAKYYRDIGEYAKEHGVSISVISIVGTECKLEHLGTAADITGGDVERVDPLNLSENFKAMLQNPVIATKVSVTMLLHSGLCFRDSAGDGKDSATRQSQEMGSVSKDSEVLYEFTVRPDYLKKFQANVSETNEATADAAPLVTKTLADAAPLVAEAPANATSLAAAAEVPGTDAAAEALPAETDTPPYKLPFQVQIRFTKPSGMECMRVLTQQRAITSQRQEAEETINVALYSAYVAQKSARLAQEGEYEAARINAYSCRNLMTRACMSDKSSDIQQQQYANFCHVMEDLDSHVQEAAQQELSSGLDFRSAARSDRTRERASRRTDSQSRTMFKYKKAATKNFL